MKYIFLLLFISLVPLPGFAQIYIVDEDFEGYEKGTVPGDPWVTRFGGDSALISQDVAVSGMQSFKQASSPSWARIDAVPLSEINDYMMYQGWAYVNQVDRGGAIGFGFKESGNTYRYRNAVFFGNDGNIHFGEFSLQEYEAQIWYKVMVYCDYTEHLAKVWINDVLMKEDVPLSTRDELTDFCIGGINFSGAGSGIIYFDDVKLYRPEFKIISVTDLPNDQGRQVRINWKAHTFDKKNFTGIPQVTSYSVWRLIDPDLTFNKSNIPGNWDFVLTIPAVQDSDYNVIVPTVADSNDKALYYSTFFIRAHSESILKHWETAPDSGYSIDNLSPAKVGGLVAVLLDKQHIELSWDECTAKDFAHYNIYRGEESGFVPGEPLAVADKPAFTDQNVEQKTFYYKISAVDFNGNEGEYSEEIMIVITDLAEPGKNIKKFGLMQNYPNPFNPLTTIQYQLPKACNVKISIFNSQGREIEVLVNQKQSSGSYNVTWDASAFSSGVYFYRIAAGSFVQTRKMLVVK